MLFEVRYDASGFPDELDETRRFRQIVGPMRRDDLSFVPV